MDAHGLTDAVLPELAALRGRRAERVPPRRRLRPHARGARRGRRARARPAQFLGDTRRPTCSPSRWPTSSRAAARCASPRCCTTPPSRRPAACGPTAASRSSATTRWAPSWRAPCCAACARPSARSTTSRRSRCHHLRLGFLVHEQPLDRRAIWRYLRATAPWTRRRHDLHRRRPARHARPQRRGGDRRPRRARARDAGRRPRRPTRAADPRRRPGARARHRARARGSASCSPSSRRTATPARSPPARRRSHASQRELSLRPDAS